MTTTEHTPKAPHSTGLFAVLGGLLRGKGSAVLVVVAALAATAASAQAAVIHEYIGNEPASAYTPFKGAGGEVVVDESTSLTDWAKGDTYEVVGANPSEGQAGSAIDVFTPGKVKVGELELNGELVAEIAVDDVTGDLIVNTNKNSVVEAFEPTMTGHWAPPTQFGADAEANRPFNSLGVDESSGEAGSGDIYDGLSKHSGTVEEFSSAGGYLGQITGPCEKEKEVPPCEGSKLTNFRSARFVSIDPSTHDVYVNTGTVVDIFGPDIFIPDVTTGAFSHLRGTSVTLAGTVNPDGEGPATCRFLWGEGSAFGKVAECSGPGSTATPIAEGDSPVPVEAKLTGLAPDGEYCYRLEASNKAKGLNPGGTNAGEESQDRCFTTPGPADIAETSASEVSADSAALHATIDPNGAPATYYFQYGRSAAYEHEAPAKPGEAVGSGETGVAVEQTVQGLSPSATYHYRIVEMREGGPGESEEFAGPDETFTTQAPGSAFVLPDGRQYEMVTPPAKLGTLFDSTTQAGNLVDSTNDIMQAAVAGDALVDTASAPSEAGAQGYSNRVEVLMTRGVGGTSSWTSQVISPPHGRGLSYTNRPEYHVFSEDLSLGFVDPIGDFTPLSPQATESTPYLHTDYLNGNVAEHCESQDLSASSCFQPLVTRADDTASPFVPFGNVINGECIFTPCGPRFVAASGDLSHVLVAAPEQLTATPVTVGEIFQGAFVNPAVYEWYGGQLRLVNILPGMEEGGGAELPSGDHKHAISADGARVILEGQDDDEELTGDLYLRDVAKEETIQLNLAEPGCGTCTSGGGEYETANSEDARIFFRDTNKLTGDASKSGSDLYECEIVEVAGKDKCDLTDLTPETGGEAANVKDVLGSSEDGSYLYFTAGGVLASGATDQTECVASRSGGGLPCNLYVRHAGVTSFIATLSAEDTLFYARHRAESAQDLSDLRARVSPDGRWLAFMSDRDLTGYDTRDANSGKPDEEVYLYHAPANLGTGSGTLACASCNPTGGRPTEAEGPANKGGAIAAIVPGWRTEPAGDLQLGAFYQPRYLSDEGRLFFDSADALVPLDVDSAVDVYQYEPENVPTGSRYACGPGMSSGSSTYKPARTYETEGNQGEEGAGCVALISSGTSPEGSTFLDASASGGDVFFVTTSKLAPQDFDHAPDIYDAQECTAAAPCVPAQAQQPPACDTEASCKAPPTPQPEIYGAPSSATFSGPGNIAPLPLSLPGKKVTTKTTKCKKGFVKNKKGKCVKRKRDKRAMKTNRRGK